jgi:serine/threonine protein phosphatase 1
MVYVSSDWHGTPLETVQALLRKANFGADDFLFILGDVIDRGAHGVELLKFLMVQPNMELLMGNHEVFLLANAWLLNEVNEDNLASFGANKLEALRIWRRNGGEATLDALRAESPESRAEILEFVRDCPVYDSVSVGERDFFLVHGGLGGYSPDKKIGEYEEDPPHPRTVHEVMDEALNILNG